MQKVFLRCKVSVNAPLNLCWSLIIWKFYRGATLNQGRTLLMCTETKTLTLFFFSIHCQYPSTEESLLQWKHRTKVTNMAIFYLCSGDSEKNYPKWPYCKDAIPKQWWLHWIHKNGQYTPNSWTSLFHSKKQSNTICCMIFFNLLVLCSMFVLQMELLSAFSFVKSSSLERHMSFHIFLNAVYNWTRNIYEYPGPTLAINQYMQDWHYSVR